MSASVIPPMSNGSYDRSHSQAPSLPDASSQHSRPFSQTPQASQQSQQPPQQQTSLSQTPQLSHQAQPRSVKRPRPVKSCTECRKRKLKCDRSCPCSQCQKSSRQCKYAADQDAGNNSDASDGEANDSQRAQKRPCHLTPTGSQHQSTLGLLEPPFSTPMRNGDVAVLAGMTLEELAMRVDRLEKHVLARSPARTELSSIKAQLSTAAPNTLRCLTVKSGASRTRFFGQSSTRVMINLFDEAKDYLANCKRIDGLRDIFIRIEALQKVMQDEHRRLIAPIPVYVDSMLPIQKRMTDIMPPKAVCDRLISSYIDTNEIIYRMVHVPTFKAQYDLYWENQLQSDYFLPQLLTVLAIGSRFTASSKGLSHERRDGVNIPTACALVRTWLDGLRGKQLVEFTTLQTELLLLHARRMMSLSKLHETWSQLGYIVRMAMTMGMHRDPDEFVKLNAFQGEMRRRLWFTILDMDLYISLASNLPCLIRDGDYTCKPPRNLDDADLYEEMKVLPQEKPIEHPTECQIQVYASMTLPLRVKVTHLVNRIDAIQDYGEVLEVGQRLDKYIEDLGFMFPRYGYVDRNRSKEWRWRVVIDMHVRRPLLALYRPFVLGVPDAPQEIVRVYLRSSLVILRYLDEMDPTLPHYDETCDMYIQILRQDIIQAAFSICWHIMNIIRQNPTNGATMSPNASGGHLDDIMPGTPSRLMATVQKSLDLLVRKATMCDLKDIIPLAVVFTCIKRYPHQMDEESMVGELQLLFEGLLRSTNTNPEKLNAKVAELTAATHRNAMASQQGQGQATGPSQGQAHHGGSVDHYPQVRSQQPFMYTGQAAVSNSVPAAGSSTCENWGYGGWVDNGMTKM
ncbi:hypothetical protein jhhlp_002176 [Lomentospora prolificans]|uniref:Zn(2)-C6 fungal-type domain-containing protein n=1 Tax=Lomentospora prolificans TaxID=41688 RepID=A0A2N3NDA5_9PEZI|nr:hypothetical protein jhhlp_002176 [Lomentospora prolificans]